MEQFSYHNPALSLAERHHNLKIFLAEYATEELKVFIAHTYDGDDCDDVVLIHINLDDIDAVIETLKTMKIELLARKARMLEEELQYIREQNARSH